MIDLLNLTNEDALYLERKMLDFNDFEISQKSQTELIEIIRCLKFLLKKRVFSNDTLVKKIETLVENIEYLEKNINGNEPDNSEIIRLRNINQKLAEKIHTKLSIWERITGKIKL